MTTKQQTLADVIAEGVALIFSAGLRPAEAATKLAQSITQFDPVEGLAVVRRGLSELIYDELAAQKRVPRFDVQAARTASTLPISEEHLSELTALATKAARKLDGYYAAHEGQIKPLREFTLADHHWRHHYSSALVATWSQWAVFHRTAEDALRAHDATMICELPAGDQQALEALVP